MLIYLYKLVELVIKVINFFSIYVIYMNVNEIIISWDRGTGNKKYKVVVQDMTGKTRTIQFGDNRYEQYKDRTPLGLYEYLDHLNSRRRRAYFSRHSGTYYKIDAIKKELIKSNNKYTSKILSHKYLW